MTLRTFFAVCLSRDVIAQIARQTSELRRHGADVAWVPEQNLHVTLRFLGEITEAQVDQLCALARQRQFEPFSLRARGLGAYPGLRNARTLWAGVEPLVEADRRKLLELHAATESWARRIGLAPESRRFTPHITIGRVRRPGPNLRALVDDLTTRELVTDEVHVESFVLMKSSLSDQAAVYEPIEEFPSGR